jgi:carbonic anhydrase
MKTLKNLFERNRDWAERVKATDPDFFTNLSKVQTPKFLWIGCSDSRVSANQIVDLSPGEIFVHRNVANLVVHTDFNCLSVIQYAVEALKIEHIVVCGHYGCGGITAAYNDLKLGLIDNWLRHVQDIKETHQSELDAITDTNSQIDRLCELNVIEQVKNISNTTIVQQAWDAKQKVFVHGWIYNLEDGRLKDLDISQA